MTKGGGKGEQGRTGITPRRGKRERDEREDVVCGDRTSDGERPEGH